MPELISHPGLRFYIFKLSGKFEYALERRRLRSRPHAIFDYELDRSVSANDPTATLEDGLDASTIGLAIRIVENDGRLTVDYTGNDGTTAHWEFDGLKVKDGQPLLVATGVQTDMDLVNSNVELKGKNEVQSQVMAGNAKPTTRTDAWPRHMYFKGELLESYVFFSGVLHIDRLRRTLH